MSEHEYCEKLISRLLDGDLSSAEREELNTHLASCAECRELYEMLRTVSEGLSSDMAEVPESVSANVMAFVRRDLVKKKNRRKKAVTSFAALAACAVLVFGAVKLVPRPGMGKAASYALETAAAAADMAPAAAAPMLPAEAPAAPEPRPEPCAEEAGESIPAADADVIFCPEAALWLTASAPVTVSEPPDGEYAVQLERDGELCTVTFITVGRSVYYAPEYAPDGSLTAVLADITPEELREALKR